jgi:hypothetical protein
MDFLSKENQNDKQKDLYASLGYLFHVSASRNRKLRRAFTKEPLANDINRILVALDNITIEPAKQPWYKRIFKRGKNKLIK